MCTSFTIYFIIGYYTNSVVRIIFHIGGQQVAEPGNDATFYGWWTQSMHSCDPWELRVHVGLFTGSYMYMYSRKPDFSFCQRGRKVWEPACFVLVRGIILRHVNGMLILCCHVQCPCTCRFWYRFVFNSNSGWCEAVSWQRVSSGYVYKRCFILLDCRVRLKA